MKVFKRRYMISTTTGRKFATFVSVKLSHAERKAVVSGRLNSCRIQTHGNAISAAFQMQMNRIRNRWNVGIQRSTGYVFLDAVGLLFLAGFLVVKQVFRVFVGTRTRFSDLRNGAEFVSRSVEEQKETEAFVFASIAAIDNAIQYVIRFGNADDGDEFGYANEVLGLNFAGGLGVATESIFDDQSYKKMLSDQTSAEHHFSELDDEMFPEDGIDDGLDVDIADV